MRPPAAVAGAPLGPAGVVPAHDELGPPEPPPTGRGRSRRRPPGSQRRVREALSRVESTVPRLLDNIPPATREAVEGRLEELERVARSKAEVRALADETGLFAATLGPTLRSGPLEGRQAALRRCVEGVELDHAARSAVVRVRAVPPSRMPGTPDTSLLF